MIERLAPALEHVGELPEDVQVELAELAEQIEQYQTTPGQGVQHARSFAGIWHDLPDDMEDTLLGWRHEATPTPPLDDRWARWTKNEPGNVLA